MSNSFGIRVLNKNPDLCIQLFDNIHQGSVVINFSIVLCLICLKKWKKGLCKKEKRKKSVERPFTDSRDETWSVTQNCSQNLSIKELIRPRYTPALIFDDKLAHKPQELHCDSLVGKNDSQHLFSNGHHLRWLELQTRCLVSHRAFGALLFLPSEVTLFTNCSPQVRSHSVVASRANLLPSGGLEGYFYQPVTDLRAATLVY